MKLKEVKIRKKRQGFRNFSLVGKPAIQIMQICLEEQTTDVIVLKMSDREKHQIVSPLLIPGKKIYRNAETMGDGEEGFVYWSAGTIRQEQQLMMGEFKNHPIKLDHESETDDAFVIETWIKEDDKFDKRDQLYYEAGVIPVGTLMLKLQITNLKLWEQIKTGNYNGISIEGEYDLEDKGFEVEASEEFDENNADEFSAVLAELIFEENEDLKSIRGRKNNGFI